MVVVLALLVLFGCLWKIAERRDLDVDEIQHAHAAWLIHAGEVPYVDFFEHHPPFYWYFLKAYYAIHGPDLAIFLWGRRWMLATFAFSLLLTFLIGRRLYGSAGAWMAFGLFTLQGQAYLPNIMMRPDGWMVVFLLLGTLSFLSAWMGSFNARQAMISGLLLGLAFAIHPRAGFTILALALSVAYDCTVRRRWGVVMERLRALILFGITSFVVIAWPFFHYGFQTYTQYVYKISLGPEQTFSPAGLMKVFLHDPIMTPLIFVGVALCLFHVVRRRDTGLAAMFVLSSFGLNIVGILVATWPFIQVYCVAFPAVALLGGFVFSEYCKGGTGRWKIAFVLFLVVVGRWIIVDPIYFLRQEKDLLSPTLEVLRRTAKAIPEGETYTGSLRSHPVFRKDGSYYWTQFDMKLFEELDPSFHHDFAAELEERKPYLIDIRDFRQRLTEEEAAHAEEILLAHYEREPSSRVFMIRRSENTESVE